MFPGTSLILGLGEPTDPILIVSLGKVAGGLSRWSVLGAGMAAMDLGRAQPRGWCAVLNSVLKLGETCLLAHPHSTLRSWGTTTPAKQMRTKCPDPHWEKVCSWVRPKLKALKLGKPKQKVRNPRKSSVPDTYPALQATGRLWVAVCKSSVHPFAGMF